MRDSKGCVRDAPGAGAGAVAVGVGRVAASTGGAEDCTPDSRSAGLAGGGPSIAHLRLSYFDRMNDSIL